MCVAKNEIIISVKENMVWTIGMIQINDWLIDWLKTQNYFVVTICFITVAKELMFFACVYLSVR